jgi:hypothetical protein
MDFNFTSQICTTKEQSERLLALGVKAETADMYHYVTSNGTGISAMDDNFLPHMDTLAWSLHRLIEIMPQWIHTVDGSFKLTIDQGKLVCYREISDEVQTFVFGHTSLYDSIIDTIEKLIKEDYFNKEYLE